MDWSSFCIGFVAGVFTPIFIPIVTVAALVVLVYVYEMVFK